MLIIGEKINIMSKTIGPAMRERNAKPIQELAVAQVEGGAKMLEVNVGPASKGGSEMMEWLVKTIQEVVDVPLSLDTTNAAAMEAGLKAHKGQALINSASGEKQRLETMMALAAKYGAKIIGLTLSESGIPRDASERCIIAADILGAAAMHGVPTEDLYLDPLALPIGVAQQQATEVLEAVKMFKQLSEPAPNTVVGLSNVSNGSPKEVQSILNRTFLVMLVSAGLDAAIADSLDKDLMDCVKSVAVFNNEVLYCHSYLE
jgi:5-methyltetrahydrofolate corrinoid/iron sulfur protein methyltransferase